MFGWTQPRMLMPSFLPITIRALEMFVVEGIKTSIPLHERILAETDFEAGHLHTHFLERFLPVHGK